jgi:dTDP-4-dehydrorhamnose reductase
MINAVGLIKQLIHESQPTDQIMATEINSRFPVRLENYCDYKGIKVIQIGTDCVYSGFTGGYTESDKFDATDLYGLTKLQGEKELKSTMTIRTSIIGKEIKSKVSLLDWFLTQPHGAEVKGFTNHHWNGVTTLAFSRITAGIILEKEFQSETIHLVPGNVVSKYELLNDFMESFGRNDLNLTPVHAETSIDRTLKTNYPIRNSSLWRNAGYNLIPTIDELIKEFAEWCEIC